MKEVDWLFDPHRLEEAHRMLGEILRDCPPRPPRRVAAIAASPKPKAFPRLALAKAKIALVTPPEDRAIARYDAAMRRPITISLRGGIGVPDDAGRKVSARNVALQLRMRPMARVLVEIDSIGGLVDQAEKIAAALECHAGETEAMVVGRCASAALTVLLACKRRRCVAGATFTAHVTALTGARRTAAWHRAAADRMEKADLRLFADYAAKTTTPAAVLQLWRNGADHPFGAADALRWGWVHHVEGSAVDGQFAAHAVQRMRADMLNRAPPAAQRAFHLANALARHGARRGAG